MSDSFCGDSTDSMMFSGTSFNSKLSSSTSGSSGGSGKKRMTPNMRYQITDQIGKGGMGVVFRCEDTKNGKVKAMKKVFCENVTDLNNAMAEIWPVRQLKHENIVTVDDVFFDNADSGKMALCMVMDFYEDGDLHKEILRRRENEEHFANSQVISYMTQLVSALAVVHDSSLIHRDLKPMNIFKQNDKVMLADFGLAKNMEESLAHTTAGTQKYMAPEMLQRSGYDRKADIWAIGATFYEIMTLKMDFVPYLEVFMNRNFYDNVRKELTQLNYASELIGIVLSCLTVDPTARPTTEDILQILQRIQSPSTDEQPAQNEEELEEEEKEESGEEQGVIDNTEESSSPNILLEDHNSGLWSIDLETKRSKLYVSSSLDDAGSIVVLDGEIYIISDYICKLEDGEVKPISKERGWASYSGVGVNGKIYLINSSGAFYSWNPVDQSYAIVHQEKWINGSFCALPSDPCGLYIYCKYIYRFNLLNGRYDCISKSDGWGQSKFACTIKDCLYTMDNQSGKIWEFSTSTGVFRLVQGSYWKDCAPIVSDELNQLYSLNGTPFVIQTNGEYTNLGIEPIPYHVNCAAYDRTRHTIWCIGKRPQ